MNKILIGIVIVLVLGAGYFWFIQREPVQMNDGMTGNQQPVGGSPATQGSSQTSTTSSKPAVLLVNIQDFSFSPSLMTVKKGDTIVWTNKDAAPHTVTWDVNGQKSSGKLEHGMAFSFTFNTAGTFSYHCAFHPGMKGKVTVK